VGLLFKRGVLRARITHRRDFVARRVTGDSLRAVAAPFHLSWAAAEAPVFTEE